jgi:Protein of unknown function (DUF4239)
VSNLVLWLSELPSWTAFIVILAAYVAFAAGVTLVARRCYAHWQFPRSASFVPPWLQLVGGLNALLFAFVIVSLWSSLHAAEANVDNEAFTIRLLYHDVAPAQRPMVIAYARSIVNGWPLLCGSADAGVAAGRLLARIERDAQPVSRDARDDVDRDLSTLEDLRARRLHATVSGVPDELWIGLVVLSGILIVMTSFIHPERADMHLALAGFVALSIALLLWVAVSLDFPFCGGTTVMPLPLQETIDALTS